MTPFELIALIHPTDLFGLIVSPAVTFHQILTAFQTDPLAIAADAVLVLAVAAYVIGVRRLAAKGRNWPRSRTAAFLGGSALIFFATGSGFASYDSSNFAMHVIQHLILMNGAPILLVLSAPVTLLLQASSRNVQTGALKVLHSHWAKFVTLPFIAWLANWVTMYVYFLTPIYTLSIQHPLFHYYTHLHFLIAGFIYWSVVISIDPIPHKMSFGAKLAFLLSGIPFGTYLGIALTQMSTSIDPSHNSLADTHLGGSILWAFGEIFTLAALAAIFVQWSHADEREARRHDRELYG